MSDGVTFDTSRIELAFAAVAEYTARTVEAEFRTVCKGIVNTWIQITPPATGKGAKESSSNFDATAQLRGLRAIKRDLFGGKGASAKRRGIFESLSDGLIDSALDSGIYQNENVRLFVKKGGQVYGTDKTHFMPAAGPSQLRSLHKAAFKNGRMSSAGARERDIGRWKFIDRYVIRQSTADSYLDGMSKKVGWLASTLNNIARLTGARIPSYARGKNAPSREDFTLSEDRLHMSFENLVDWAPNAAGGDMARRYQSALDYQANAMFRRIPYMMAAAAKRAGFKAAA